MHIDIYSCNYSVPCFLPPLHYSYPILFFLWSPLKHGFHQLNIIKHKWFGPGGTVSLRFGCSFVGLMSDIEAQNKTA